MLVLVVAFGVCPVYYNTCILHLGKKTFPPFGTGLSNPTQSKSEEASHHSQEKDTGRRIVTTTSIKTSFPAAVAVVLVAVEEIFLFFDGPQHANTQKKKKRTHARSFPAWEKGLF